MTTSTPTTPPLDLDLLAATLVRPGSLADVARLQYIGGRVLHRGDHVDGETGATHPAVLVRIGRQRVLVVLSRDASDTQGAQGQHHARAPAWSERRRAA